jgi:multiple sugar transport system substrate-binding protein
MKKRIFVLLAAGLCLAAFAFAGGQKEPTAATGELKVWVLGASNFIPGYNKLFGDFEMENPGLKVNRVDMAWEELSEKITTSFAAGGELPDLTEVPVTFISPYIPLGQFEEVPSSVMSATEIKQAHWPQTTSFLLHGGKYYGLPATYTTDKVGVLYNKRLWREAGVAPQQASDWEAFMKLAQKLTKRDASGAILQAGLENHGGEEEETIFGWILQYGGKLLSGDGKRWVLNSPQGKQALQTYYDVPNKWKVDDPKLPWEAFSQEQSASRLIGPWYGFVLKQDFPSLEWGFFLQPKLTNAPPYFVLTVDWVRVVPKVSKNKAAAFRWLKYMTDIERSAYWSLACGELSAIRKANEQPEVLADPALGPLAPVLQYGVAVDLKNAQRFRDGFYATLDEILYNKISLDQGLAKLEDGANQVYKEYE